MCNLKKRLIRAAFEYSYKRCLWTTENKRQSDWKCKRLLTINKRNIIRWKLKFMFSAGFQVFAVFKVELEARRSFKAFFLQPNWSMDALFWQLSIDHNIDVQSVFSWAPWDPKVARKHESKHWYACGADGRRSVGVQSHDYQMFWDG